ncbi:MAG: MBL fold metallo-hydrolase [Acidobacteriota bacterium]
MSRLALLTGLFGTLMVAARAQVGVEYIAHACFIVESPSGVRLLIDPYNAHRWLGYTFPRHLKADGVLVTHPHYDHDASYYFDAATPVFRRPGKYGLGDIRISGFEGKHADPYGKDFGQINTLWLVETGGLRILHLGDNGPLRAANIAAVGRVDILMIPIDSSYHILKAEEIDALLAALRPKVVLPMHYKIPSLYPAMGDLGPIDPWLEGRGNATRLSANHKVFSNDSLPAGQVFVFQPSPSVKPWSASLGQAWVESAKARRLMQEAPVGARRKALEHIRQATVLAPDVIVFWWGLGSALKAAGQMKEAIRVLEHGLASAGRDDWEYSMRSRALLAGLYHETGQDSPAAEQYRVVLLNSYRSRLKAEAKRFLEP